MTRMIYDFLFVSVPDHFMVRYVIGDFEVAGQQPILLHGSFVVKLYFVQLLLLLSCCQFLGGNLKTDVEVPAVCGFGGGPNLYVFGSRNLNPRGGVLCKNWVSQNL